MNYKDETTTLSDLKKLMKNFVDDREWVKYHDPKNLSMSIAIEAAELMELFQWLKNDEAVALKDDPERYVDICDEVSDIMLYCMSLGNVLNIDLSKAIAAKVEKNKIKYPADKCRGNYKKPMKKSQ